MLGGTRILQGSTRSFLPVVSMSYVSFRMVFEFFKVEFVEGRKAPQVSCETSFVIPPLGLQSLRQVRRALSVCFALPSLML